MFYCYLLLLYSFGHQKGYNHPDSLYLFRYLQQLAEQTDPMMIEYIVLSASYGFNISYNSILGNGVV